MGNRKLPFGYQMRMGEIIRNEPEAKAVQDIFLQYPGYHIFVPRFLAVIVNTVPVHFV